jgi:hypothetical protein
MAGSVDITGRQHYVPGIGHSATEVVAVANNEPTLVVYNPTTQSLVSADGNILIPVVGGLSTENTLAAATANTTVIQAALNAGGLVQILAPGTYYYSYPSGGTTQGSCCVIASNTHLRLGAGVTLKQLGNNGGRAFLRNANYASTVRSVTSISTAVSGYSTSYRIATAVCTGHGFAVGNNVLIKGDTSGNGGNYNGVWEVLTVADANTFTFLITATTNYGAASGTITAALADVNITIEGGTIDYNVATNASPAVGLIDGQAITLNKIRNGVVRNQVGKNGIKELHAFANFQDCIVENCEYDTGNGGMCFRGPGWNGIASNLRGQCSDDISSAITVDVLSASINAPDSGGSIRGVAFTNIMGWHTNVGRNVTCAINGGHVLSGLKIDGVHSFGSNFLAVFLGVDLTESGTIQDADVRNITGGFASAASGTAPVAIAGPSSVGTLTIGNVMIDGVKPRDPSSYFLVAISGRVAFKEISIKNVKQRPLSLEGLIQCNGANITGDVLNIEDVRLDSDATNAAARMHVCKFASADVKRVRISRASINSNAGTTRNSYFYQIFAPGANNRFEVVDSEVNAIVGSMAEFSTITNAPTLYYRGITFNAATNYFQSCNESCTVMASDIDVIACVDIFIISGTSKTVNFNLMNFRINGENFCTNYGTTNTLNWAGGDGSFRLNFDASKFTFASGSLYYNTNAGHGAGVGMYAQGAASGTRIAA